MQSFGWPSQKIKKKQHCFLSESIKLFLIRSFNQSLFLSKTGVYREGVKLPSIPNVSNVKICLRSPTDVIQCKFGKNKILFVFLF